MVAATGVAGVLAACRDSPPPVSIAWADKDGYRERPLSFRGEPLSRSDGGSGGRFTSLSSSRTGIAATPVISAEALLANRTLAHGAGVALGDVDGDGWADIYICMLDRPNVLYRNMGGWRFEDVTARSNAGLPGRVSRGAVMADADGDGDLDIFVAVHGGTNALLANDGSGVFSEGEPGFEGAYGSSTLALADIDGDSDLDAYFANYKTIQGDDLFSPAERGLRGHVERVDGELVVMPPFDEHYKLEVAGERSLRFELADPDELYLNDGSGRFERVAMDGGTFRTAEGETISTVPRDWGLVARFFDADDDGDPDLYVANDFGSRDGFWFNEGGRFVAASGLALRTESASSMGVDFSDIDGDGDTDFVTTEMLAFEQERRRLQVPIEPPAWTPPGGYATRVSAARNTLQLNRGDGTYAEVARAAGVNASEWTWGAIFLDVDLDGREDLLVTNGHAWDPLDGDTQEALRRGAVRVEWREELGVFPPLRQRNLAFRNLGGTFQEMSRRWGYGTEPDVSHGIAAADLDRDGDRDLVVTRLGEPPSVLRNDAGGARVALRVLGEPGNTQAVGARVALAGGAVPAQTRQVTSGGMYLSGSAPGFTFAMGDRAEATATITWPSGRQRTIAVVANHGYEVMPPPPDTSSSLAGQAGDASAASLSGDFPLFSPAESVATHRDVEFDEIARQPLIPVELSRGGPGVAWADADGDGDPDLLVGAGKGHAVQVVTNVAGRLAGPAPLGGPAPGDYTSIVALPGAGGRPAVIAGVSSWEAASSAEAVAIVPLARLDGRTGSMDIEPSPGATGPLAAADVDGDGDIDLFVGARATPGAYPLPVGSRIILAESEGVWAAGRRDAALPPTGLVSGAVFSDADDDGDPDLLLAVDWGPIRLLENDAGRFTDKTDEWGLGEIAGRWNGIAVGDLNGDGLPDLVATGWGNNTGRMATPLRPAGVIASDFDGNGLVDLIEYESDPAGARRPVRDFIALSGALPFIRRSVPTFEAFARASVDDLLGSGRSRLYEARVTTLRHTVFLNRGTTYEARPLPESVQLAPAFGVVVADFDRDGAEDIFLGQNYLAAPPGLPRHDAGRGAVLLGDGRGDFRPLDARESGVVVWGDARGAAVADFDGDGRWDLAVGQNGGETLVFRGRGGEAALRVRVGGGTAGAGGVVGARLRPRYADGAEGPAREIRIGSGYWSMNGVVQLFGRAEEIDAVVVRWPDGSEEEFEAPDGVREVVLRKGEGS